MFPWRIDYKECSLIFLGLIWLGFSLVAYSWHETFFFWNQIRLAPSYALSLGAPLYGHLDKDPLVWHLYGPFAPIFYYPAILVSHPLTALVLGICMSWGIMLIAFWSCLRVWGASISKTVGILLFIFALAFHFRIAWDLFRIMADLPAVGFAFLALALAWRGKSFWCGFFLLLSLASKQTMFPMVLFVCWMLFYKKGTLREMLYGIGIAGLPLLIGLGLTDQLQTMVDSTILLPLSHPWKNFDSGESHFHTYLSQLIGPQSWLLLGFILSRIGAQPFIRTKEIQWIRFCSVLGIVFYCVGALQSCKIGGTTNAFFPSLMIFYSLLPMWALWFCESTKERFSLVKKIGSGLAILFLGIIAVQSLLLINELKTMTPHPASLAYQNCIEHPKRTYEIHLPLSQMMAEKRVYHIGDVLQNCDLGRTPVPEENQKRWLPEGTELMNLRYWKEPTK